MAIINNNQELIGAEFEGGTVIPTYDDGSGRLWITWDSGGVTSIIRAETFETAWGIWEDEFAPEAEEATYEAMAKECGYVGPIDELYQDAVWQENYGTRPNGARKDDEHKHGIYAKDLNGNMLQELSQWVIDSRHIKLVIKDRE